MSKPILFDDNSDEEENVALTINKNYAERYDKWRELEIKSKLEDKYRGFKDGQDSSSESSTDEEEVEELKKVVNKDFFEVISSLKTKDPKIYQKEVQFFQTEKASEGFDPVARKNKKKSKEKPLYLRDYERKLITERGGKLSDDESDHEHKQVRAPSPSYVEEQEQLKESFKKAIQDDESDDESGLLQKKEKSEEEKRKEEDDYIEWMKGEKDALPDKEAEKNLKPLQNLWNDPNLDEGEKFLRDYILNKRYLDDGMPDDGNVTDEDMDKEREEFEIKYNFRFEEPDREFLKRYPRTLENSLRKKDTRRKERREAVKTRKEEEKQKKKEELKLLKALKRKEILDKIEKIKAITGNDQLGLDPEELEGDFDPEAHDRKMRELFNDEYYQGAEDADDEDELNLPPLEEELMDDDCINWDEWDGTDRTTANEEEDANYLQDDGPHCEDPDFNMDCDYDPATDSLRLEEKAAGRQSARERRKLKRQSRFGRLVRREKPVFNPNDKTFEQYVDEYYGMDYEDLIGDIPCRFKYKTVTPNNFGLTIDEILAADDKELNQWASIKKVYKIRPDYVDKNEAKIYAEKAQNEELKRKILPSLYRHEADNSNHNGIENGEETKKKRNKKKKHSEGEAENFVQRYGDLDSQMEKKKRKEKNAKVAASSMALENENNRQTGNEEDAKGKKKKKRKHSEGDANNYEIQSFDPIVQEHNFNGSKKKKEKEKKNVDDVASTGTSENDNNSQPYDDGKKDKKKKKKKEKLDKETSLETPNNEHSSQSGVNDKKERKNKKKKLREGDAGTQGDESHDQVSEGGEANDTPEQKRKEKNAAPSAPIYDKSKTDKKRKWQGQESEQGSNHGNKKARTSFGHAGGPKKNFKQGSGPKKNFKQESGPSKNFSQGNDSKQNFKKGGPKKSFSQGNGSSKNLQKRNNNDKKSEEQSDFTDARLKAYGMHPKRYRNYLKYGHQN